MNGAVRREYKLTLILAVACVVMLLLMLIEWSRAEGKFEYLRARLADPPEEVGITVEQVPDHDFVLLPKESYVELVERPLFIEERRPVEEGPDEAAPTVAAQVTKLTVQLMGVISTPEGTIGLFRDQRTGKYRRASVGEDVDGWRLASVSSDRVVFEQAGSEEPLELRKPKPKSAPPPAATTPPTTGQQPGGGAEAREEMKRKMEERRKQLEERRQRLRQGGNKVEEKEQ